MRQLLTGVVAASCVAWPRVVGLSLVAASSLASFVKLSRRFQMHHLRGVGRQGPLFSDGFLALVHDHTKGVARTSG